MRSPMRTEWIQSKDLEMQGLWSRGVFQKVPHPSLPKIQFSALASTTRLKEKGVNSTNAKSDSLYNVNIWNTKALTELAIMMSLLARCLLLAVSALFSVLPPNSTCLLIMSTFSQSSVLVELLPGDGHDENVYIEYISSPPGFKENSWHIYRLLKPLHGMPSAAHAWHTAMSDSWSLSHLGHLYPGTTPVMIKLDHNRSCPWVWIAQVTKAPTIITKVPQSVPGSTRVITYRGVFRLRAGVQK